MKKVSLNFFSILAGLLVMCTVGEAFAQGYSGGSGTSTDPYQIQTFNDLKYLSEHTADWGFYFKQTADIDASSTANPTYNSGKGFFPIGNTTVLFSGQYDGQDHTIGNLYINRSTTDFVGLFGLMDAFSGIVSNLGLLNVNITGQSNVGAIAGLVNQLVNCYSVGNVSGQNAVGGAAGYLFSGVKTYSTCNVSGADYIGGIAGILNSGNLYNCYATGEVSGDDFIGGLIGWNSGSVIKWCYSTGMVTGTTNVGGLVGYSSGVVENCFWDVETSLAGVSAGGTGKTTAEMKRVTTYLYDPSIITPWDFTLSGETWGINGVDNNGYPFLRYQGFPPAFIWYGNASSDWSNAVNWSEGSAPSAADRAIIPDVPAISADDPVLSGTAEILDLKIEPGGSPGLAPTGHLTIHGTLVIE